MTARSIRVLLVTGEYPPDQGGVGDYTAHLAQALVAEGCQAGVLTRRRHRWSVPHAPHESVPVYRAVPRWDLWTPHRVRSAAALVRPDVVHFQHQEAAFDMSFGVHLAPAWIRRTRACVAITYHDLAVPYLFPKAGRLRAWVSRLPAHSANLVVATTAADQRDLASAGVAAEVIPIGSNIDGPGPEGVDADWRARHAPGANPLLVYFGLLNSSKGLASLAGLMSRLAESGADARLVVVGSGTGSSDATNHDASQSLRAAMDAAGVTERVSYTGHLPADEVAAWLAVADAVVLPYDDGASFRRGSLLAALRCGAAIVTTTPQSGAVGPPLPDLRHEHSALLVPPRDVDALYQAVVRLCGERELAARLRSEARALSGAFSWTAIARRHTTLYQRCVLGATVAAGG
jgi:glycosyltransferase involved in cell wall biosynthesis